MIGNVLPCTHISRQFYLASLCSLWIFIIILCVVVFLFFFIDRNVSTEKPCFSFNRTSLSLKNDFIVD